MTQFTAPRRSLRLAPLAAAALAGSAAADTLDVSTPPNWRPGDRSGVAALLGAVRAQHRPTRTHAPATAAVTSCADDGAPGTLRARVAAAGEGDTLDLGNLQCSRITLHQGAIPVQLNDLTLSGPGARRLAIDGAGLDRVFVHYGYGTLRISGLTVRNGANRVSGYHIAGGACILSGGYVTLDHSTVSGCVSSGEGAYGGGILAPTITLYTSTLSGNTALGSHPSAFTAAYGGGAMAYLGAIGLYDSTVSGNRAAHELSDTHGSYCIGGGIFADAGGYVLRSTVNDNYSYGTGGGMAGHGGFFITNSTISGNTAKFKKGGGVFARAFDDSVVLNNSTLAFNTARYGGGLYVSGLPRGVVLQSTIVAMNGADDIATLNALTVAGTNNLVMTAAAALALPVDTLRDDPLLLPLTNNGGPTLTHALAAASPARNAGNNAAGLTTDQRGPGFPRVIGAAADIGAIESAAAQAAPGAAPTLGGWASMLLASLLAGLGWRSLRARA